MSALETRLLIGGERVAGATHPGGSVIGLNGRNAGMAVLEDAGYPPSSRVGMTSP